MTTLTLIGTLLTCALALTTFFIAVRCAKLTAAMAKNQENMNRRIYNLELEASKQKLIP